MTNQSLVNANPGRNFLFQVSTGVSPDTFVTVAGLRATDVTINGNPVDISSKSSAGWQEMLPGAGIRSADITANGVFDAGNPQLASVLASALAGGGFIEAQIVSGAGDKIIGTWVAATFKRNGSHNDAEMFDVTLKSSGAVTYSKT